MTDSELIPIERIRQTIILLRGQKVMLDRDLAMLYGVPTKALKRAVKRNAGRFPEDFMFVLTHKELADWRCQFGSSKSAQEDRLFRPGTPRGIPREEADGHAMTAERAPTQAFADRSVTDDVSVCRTLRPWASQFVGGHQRQAANRQDNMEGESRYA